MAIAVAAAEANLVAVVFAYPYQAYLCPAVGTAAVGTAAVEATVGTAAVEAIVGTAAAGATVRILGPTTVIADLASPVVAVVANMPYDLGGVD